MWKVAAVAVSASGALGQTVHIIPDSYSPNGDTSYLDLSFEGARVTGGLGTVWSWTSSEGRIDYPYSGRLSQDAAFVSYSDFSAAWRRDIESGDVVELAPNDQWYYHAAYGINRTGTAIWGIRAFMGPGRSYSGWVWTEGGGWRGSMVASDVSEDGVVVVGSDLGPGSAGVRWARAYGGGYNGLLPGLVPEVRPYEANETNHDGSIIVGGSSGPDQLYHAVRWADGVVYDLGVASFGATGLSDDGSVVVGRGFIWSEEFGMLTTAEYMSRHGVAFPGTPWANVVVSGDGRTFAGVIESSPAPYDIWVVTIPAPASATILLSLVAFRRRR